MDIKDMTTDQLLELLAWVRDREAYRRACRRPSEGADIVAAYAAMDELGRRGQGDAVFRL